MGRGSAKRYQIRMSFLKMALVICLPLILVIGTYELKTVVTVSCIEFALFLRGHGQVHADYRTPL